MTLTDNKLLMNLDKLLDGVIADEKFKKITITGINQDSRKIKSGNLFIALNGEHVNGVEYINNAIEQGAAAILWDATTDASSNVDVIKINWRKTSNADVPIIAVTDLKQKTSEFASRFFGYPSHQISVCGITGTNGKTSCGHFIAQAISVDEPCGLLGTLGSGIYNNLTETGYTTPDAVTCQQWLNEVQFKRAKFAVMEVSSHALVQGRVNSIHFNSAVFTNLSHEHLDFHGDMKNYLQAKLKLFTLPGLKNAVVNIDAAAGRTIVNQLADTVRCIRYGLDNEYEAEVMASNLKLNDEGLTMQVKTPWGEGELKSPIMGRFNASNLLAVLSVLLLHGIEFNEALKRLSKLNNVPGRMQCLGGNKKPLVIVDYAHTPDALEKVLNSLREHTQNQIWCVFGCGGDRDKAKRPVMGSIAEAKADYVVLTNDNPRNENPESIISDIKAGMHTNKNIFIENDRYTAIHYAINQAKKGDVVLIAGKGHENYQLIGDKKYPFNDVEEASKQLEVLAG